MRFSVFSKEESPFIEARIDKNMKYVFIPTLLVAFLFLIVPGYFFRSFVFEHLVERVIVFFPFLKIRYGELNLIGDELGTKFVMMTFILFLLWSLYSIYSSYLIEKFWQNNYNTFGLKQIISIILVIFISLSAVFVLFFSDLGTAAMAQTGRANVMRSELSLLALSVVFPIFVLTSLNITINFFKIIRFKS